MTVLEVALTEREVAEIQCKARALREQMAQKPARAKVTVEAAVLVKVLNLIGEAVPKGESHQSLRDGTTSGRVTGRPGQGPDDEISPQEAASILRMSRPSVMRLIAKGHLHPRKVLSRNRLSRAEVLAFQKRNAKRQREALERLSALSEEYDF